MVDKAPRRKNLVIPPELGRIQAVRERINDPTVVRRKDQQQVMDDNNRLREWEKKVKEALVILSLGGNDGIAMILEKMDEELAAIDEALRSSRPADFSPDGIAKYAYVQKGLFDRRDLWEWFRGLFTEAKRSIREVRQDLDLQEEEEELTPGY